MHSKNKDPANLTPPNSPNSPPTNHSNPSTQFLFSYLISTQQNMSLQAQPQQPVQVYPTTVTNQPPSPHSNGSFGTVFIVLAIILVISVVACVLGRLCNRRYSKSDNLSYNHHHSQRHVVKPPNRQQQIHNMHSPREGDIEFGVDHKRIPTVATRPINGSHVHHGAGTGPQLQPHGASGNNIKGFEMKHGHEGVLRADA